MKLTRLDCREWHHYQQLTHRYLGVRLPNEYLARGTTWTIGDSAIEAAFTVVHEPSFRSLAQIPREHSTRLAERLRGRKLIEVNGLFVAQNASASTRRALWQGLGEVLGESEASHLVYSYDSDSLRLRALYSRMTPELLYEGEVLALSGMAGPSHERVELARTTIAARILKGAVRAPARCRGAQS